MISYIAEPYSIVKGVVRIKLPFHREWPRGIPGSLCGAGNSAKPPGLFVTVYL